MKVLNVIWGFTLGAGIDKCYLTYVRLGDVNQDIQMKNVCINVRSRHSHLEPLRDLGITFIDIRNPYDLSWIWKLKRCAENFHPDVFFSHGFNGAIMAMIEKWFGGLKARIVLTYHGEYYAPTKKKKVLAPIYNHLNYFIFSHIAYRTICVSEYSRQYLLRKGVPQKKIVTVHNGICDMATSKQMQLHKDRINILTVSRIDKIKGLDVLLEALLLLKTQKVEFHYYMIGEGPELESCAQYCKKHELEKNVTFVGFQNNVADWLSGTDIYAITSYFENHSIAILEAMRAGKAIVATNVGGNGESIRDMQEGLLVPSGNTEALAAALERLIVNKELRENLARNARKRFEEEFTEEVMMKNLVSALEL